MIRVSVLGCGSSGGVPLVGCRCDICTSSDPRNRRLRSSITVEGGGTRILVDSGPDLRQQLLSSGINKISAVVYTHCHADHVHGIDEMRSLNDLNGGPIDAYGDQATLDDLQRRFGYAFSGALPKGGFWYQPSLVPKLIAGAFQLGGLAVTPFAQSHGIYREPSIGLRFGSFAYSTDVKEIPEEGFRALEGVRVWLVDCLSEKENPAHSHLERTLAWIARVRPERAILTHMNHTLDYDALRAKLPKGVEPAFDGMAIEAP